MLSALGCRVHSLARAPVSLQLFMATGQRAGCGVELGGEGLRLRGRGTMTNGVSRR